MKPSESYSVSLQNPSGAWIEVGILRGVDNRNWFRTLPEYWALPRRPTLGQIFEEHGPDWSPTTHVAVPRWFSHLLPEGQLRTAVSAASGIKPERELQLLARLGANDLPGAIRILPINESGEVMPPEAAEEMYEDLTGNSPVLKFSLAGLQMKFSVRQSERGLTVPISGEAGEFILKTPDQRANFDGVPEAEYALMRLAAASGMEASDVELINASDVAGLSDWADIAGQSLLVRRFDRRESDLRIHSEELAQVLDIATGRAVDQKYLHANFETIANIVAKLAGVASVREVIQRIVLNVLAGNGDAHLKNWSFVYPDGAHPRLSPAYDLVPTVLFVPNDDLGLNLNRSKIFANVTPESFRKLGERSGFGGTEAVAAASEAVQRVMENWSILADVLPASRMRILDAHRDSLQLLRGRY